MSKYQIVVCDPPFSFLDKLKHSSVKRGAEANYDILDNNEILNLPIKEIADPSGAILALWVPSSLLEFGIELMNKWSFKLKQTFIWVKIKKKENLSKNIKDGILNENALSFGMGRLCRQSHELCLLGINNNNIYKILNNKSQRSVCFYQNLKHSQKPECLQDSLDLMFPDSLDKPINKIELFARRSRPGWLCIGNESPESFGIDIRDSLKLIIDKNENIAA